jgi:hypothetical protein
MTIIQIDLQNLRLYHVPWQIRESKSESGKIFASANAPQHRPRMKPPICRLLIVGLLSLSLVPLSVLDSGLGPVRCLPQQAYRRPTILLPTLRPVSTHLSQVAAQEEVQSLSTNAAPSGLELTKSPPVNLLLPVQLLDHRIPLSKRHGVLTPL